MHDSGESDDLSVCHTIKMTCLSICQSCRPSVYHSIKMTCLSVCQSHQTSVSHTIKMTSPSKCGYYMGPVNSVESTEFTGSEK